MTGVSLPAPNRTALRVGATICLALLWAVTEVTAQPQSAPWATLGYRFGQPMEFERDSGVVNQYGTSGRGSSFSHTMELGLGLDVPLDPFVLRSHLSATVTSSRFEADAFPVGGGTPSQNLTEPAVLRFDLDAVSLGLRGDVRAELGLLDWLRVSAGLWGSVRLWSSMSRHEEIVAPSTARFGDGTTRRLTGVAEAVEAWPLRVGAVVGVTPVSLRLGGVAIRPELDLSIDAEALARGLGTRALAAGVRLSFTTQSVIAAPTPTSGLAEEPRPDNVERGGAHVHLLSSGGDVVGIRARRVITRLRISLPRAIPADSLLTWLRSDAPAPDRRALIEASPHDALPLTPHVLRSRAAEGADVVLQIAPGDAAGAGAAAMLAEYLTASGARVTIQRDAMSARGEVRIRTADDGLLAPFEASWERLERDVDAIRVVPYVAPGTHVRSWRLVIQRSGREIGTRIGTDAPPAAFTLDLPLGDPPTPGHRDVLVAVFDVDGSASGILSSSDSITLHWGEPDPRAEEIDRWWIHAGDAARDAAADIDEIVRIATGAHRVSIRPCCPAAAPAALTVTESLSSKLRRAASPPASLTLQQPEPGSHPTPGCAWVVVEVDRRSADVE